VRNHSAARIEYKVVYRICDLHGHAERGSATAPVLLALCTSKRADVSAGTTAVIARSIDGTSLARPLGFVFDPSLGTAGGYRADVPTAGLVPGTHTLEFTAARDPMTHSIRFAVPRP